VEKQLAAMKVLTDAGIPEAIAVGMVKALDVKPKKKKKTYFGNSTKREKVNAPIVILQTCMTCKTETSYKRVMQVYSDETEIQQSCIVGQCENCIQQYRNMPKEQLISLIILMNHTDVELRNLSTVSQIKLAEKRSPVECLTTHMNHAIAWGDKDKDDSTKMEGVNLNLR
jgi:hypothetical protein